MPGFGGTIDEYRAGKLHSGSKSGPIVKKRAQAVAIALNQARKEGANIPRNAKGKGISGAIRKHLGGRKR